MRMCRSTRLSTTTVNSRVSRASTRDSRRICSSAIAIGGREEYDDAYYAAFFKANRAVVERRLNEAIAASAAMIAGAWEAAGKPPVPVDPRPTVQRRRR